MTSTRRTKPSNKSSKDKIAELESKISDLNGEIVELREKVFTQRSEIHSMHNSRVLGKVIKTRDKIGNPYTIPSRSINKTRRTVARFIPDNIRLPLMQSLRKTRNNVKQKRDIYLNQLITIDTVDNARWKNKAPLVSVVIPYYNRADTIDETLESLRKQTFKNFEVIVVDDLSNDPESIKKFDNLKDVKLIRHKINSGVSAARNNGIASAQGKYIVCLDSDDMIEETFIEKATLVLETNPDVSLVSTYQDMFGVVNEIHEKHPYDPHRLLKDNMIITAAQFRREAWEKSGGYKSDIGYEDWEFWLTLAENGFWGKQIPEPLFKYRTSMQSRYVEDKDVHWKNLKKIADLHKDYKKIIKSLLALRRNKKHIVNSKTALINLDDSRDYKTPKRTNDQPNVLIAMPWMTFGGAETLVYNFCRQTSSTCNISFVTGIQSENSWEYKFKEISKNIYHLPNIFDDEVLYFEFLSNYIKTRNIDILHIVHTDFLFPILSKIKKAHPHIKVIVTMFNDRVPNYVSGVVSQQDYVDALTTDNQKTATSFSEKIGKDKKPVVIPNGIDSKHEFNVQFFDVEKRRDELGLKKDDIAIFFIGRLSEEKNPDIFIKIAKKIASVKKYNHAKFFIIGDGPMMSDCVTLIKDLKLQNITILGYKKEIAQYLSSADIFILPSSIEGFPLSILEAMSMNTGVIASRVGAIPDIIQNGQNGMIMKPSDVEAGAKCLEKLLDDPKLLASIQKKGRLDAVSMYSIEELGENYKKLYNKVLG